MYKVHVKVQFFFICMLEAPAMFRPPKICCCQAAWNGLLFSCAWEFILLSKKEKNENGPISAFDYITEWIVKILLLNSGFYTCLGHFIVTGFRRKTENLLFNFMLKEFGTYSIKADKV